MVFLMLCSYVIGNEWLVWAGGDCVGCRLLVRDRWIDWLIIREIEKDRERESARSHSSCRVSEMIIDQLGAKSYQSLCLVFRYGYLCKHAVITKVTITVNGGQPLHTIHPSFVCFSSRVFTIHSHFFCFFCSWNSWHTTAIDRESKDSSHFSPKFCDYWCWNARRRSGRPSQSSQVSIVILLGRCVRLERIYRDAVHTNYIHICAYLSDLS